MIKNKIYQGDVFDVLPTFDSNSVDCIITSPPYWGLRDYGVEGQLGTELYPEIFITHMTEVFKECKRILRKDGTLWLNIGDSYAAGKSGRDDSGDNGRFAGKSSHCPGRRAIIYMK